jgi:hypothetical protein
MGTGSGGDDEVEDKALATAEDTADTRDVDADEEEASA